MDLQQIINNCIKFNHWLLSSDCVLCTASVRLDIQLCQGCYDDLPWYHQPQCLQCGLLSNHVICGKCLKESPYFDATHAALRYEFPLDAMMQRYKYGASLQFGNIFAQLLLTRNLSREIDLLIPMPLHPQRLQERGFNQSLEIAKVLAKKLQILLDYQSVIRTKLTPPQASLPLKERAKNIKGVFAVNGDLTGKRIAIVDDVMTSGASLNELAKILKKAGAAHVECWVVARTLPH